MEEKITEVKEQLLDNLNEQDHELERALDSDPDPGPDDDRASPEEESGPVETLEEKEKALRGRLEHLEAI
ncbi:MAG: hypothetical protein LC623_04650 [Halobacteriales archaeon]|nr:hypothetical protein [Halobacteriales archaeon]